MSRHRPKGKKRGLSAGSAPSDAEKRTQPAKEPVSRKWLARLLLGGPLLLFLVLVLVFFVRTPRTRIPEVNLSQADPKVAVSLKEKMAEVRRRPGSAEAWGWLGALFWVYDFRPAACVCLAEAERLDSSNPRWPYYRSLALIIATPDEAIPLLQRTVRLCGNTPEAPRFRLARLLAERGDWEGAGAEVQALLGEHPEFAPARLLTARAASMKGDLQSAGELAKTCTNDPRTARSAWSLLAGICRQKGDATAADDAARRSAAAPEDEGFSDPFEREATQMREDPRGLSEQAHALLAAGRLPEATRLIERLEQEHSDYPETWLLIGRLRLLRKDLAPAEQALRKHLALSPRSAQGVFQLGMVMLAQERFADAASVFDQATKLKPDYGPAYYNRGYALGRAGQVREAIAAFRESLRHNPEHLDAYVLLADLHLRLGEREAALQLLDQARALNPADPRLLTLRNQANAIAPGTRTSAPSNAAAEKTPPP